SARFASGLAFGEFAVDEGARFLPVALLSDAGDVEHAVDPAVAAEVESVLHRQSCPFAGGESDGAGAAPAGELRLSSEPERVTDLGQQGGGGDGADAGFVAQCGAVFVEELVDVGFEAADLTASCSVLVDEWQQPRQSIGAGQRGHDRRVDHFEATEAAFDLAGGGELVADLDGNPEI